MACIALYSWGYHFAERRKESVELINGWSEPPDGLTVSCRAAEGPFVLSTQVQGVTNSDPGWKLCLPISEVMVLMVQREKNA